MKINSFDFDFSSAGWALTNKLATCKQLSERTAPKILTYCKCKMQLVFCSFIKIKKNMYGTPSCWIFIKSSHDSSEYIWHFFAGITVVRAVPLFVWDVVQVEGKMALETSGSLNWRTPAEWKKLQTAGVNLMCMQFLFSWIWTLHTNLCWCDSLHYGCFFPFENTMIK